MKRYFTVRTFEQGYWYNKKSGWGRYETGERSSSQKIVRSKRRAVEMAKNLAEMCGSSVMTAWFRVDGDRCCIDMHFSTIDVRGE